MEGDVGAKAIELRFDDFEEGRTRLSFEVTAEEIELADAYFAFPTPLQVELSVQRSLETFMVEGEIRCSVEGECCRCLAGVEKEMTAPLRLLFQRKQATAMELEAVEEEDDVEIFDPGTQEVDLVDHLRDAVVTEVPVRIYCRQDCKGLCPQCGCDLNAGECSCSEETVDPRWAGLKELKFS